MALEPFDTLNIGYPLEVLLNNPIRILFHPEEVPMQIICEFPEATGLGSLYQQHSEKAEVLKLLQS